MEFWRSFIIIVFLALSSRYSAVSGKSLHNETLFHVFSMCPTAIALSLFSNLQLETYKFS